MNTDISTKLLTSSQVAKKLQVHAKSLYKLMDEGNFPRSVRSGHMHRWREFEIDEWMTANKDGIAK